MKNLGLKSQVALSHIGVFSIEDLRRFGWKAALLLFAQSSPKFVNLNMAYALYASIENKSWLSLTSEERSVIQLYVKEIKKQI